METSDKQTVATARQPPHVSIVLALHREGEYIPRALASLADAARYAAAFGITTEMVAVLDRPDAATEAAVKAFDFGAFDRFVSLRVDHGSLGPTRNSGCAVASGTYIATADADDLVSFNYIERMFSAAQEADHLSILIPEYVVAFDAAYFMAEYFGLEEVTPFAVFSDHPFVSRVLFHRSLCDRLRYHDIRRMPGYAYEDWHFNCNAIAAGYTFRVVPQALLFYRQRQDGLLHEGRRTSIGQIPPSALFLPDRYREVCAPFLRRIRSEGDFRSAIPRKGKRILSDPLYRDLFDAVHAIDPAITCERLESAHCFDYLGNNLDAAVAYYDACQALAGKEFDDIVLTTSWAAPRRLASVSGAADRRILLLCQGAFDRRALHGYLPKGSAYIDLSACRQKLKRNDLELLCLKIIQHCKGTPRLHLAPHGLPLRFSQRFSPVLAPYQPLVDRVGYAGALASKLQGILGRVGV